MQKHVLPMLSLALFLVAAFSPALAQPGVFSKEDVIRFTPQWKGERLPDGRPKVSDELLERMKKVNMEDAWSVLRRY
ncbi:MAG: RraA family protein, partial [Candidatus Latescibacterota bacterium]